MNVKEWYDELKGESRVINGELTIPGFDEEAYNELYLMLLEDLKDHIGDDYEFWYMKQTKRYHNFKKNYHNTDNFYDPQVEKPFFHQSVREQLATIKFYLQRRRYSRHGLKNVSEG